MKEEADSKDSRLSDQQRKTQANEAFWAAQRARFEQSGLSRKAFCRQEGLSYNKFQYWLHKQSRVADDTPGFVAVVAKTASGSSPTVVGTLVLAGHRQLHIHDAQILYQTLLQVM